MKKSIVWVLILSLCLPVLMTACGGVETPSESASQSESVSASESETESETEPLPEIYEGDADLVIYADAENGSDDGDGSDESPYASIPAAYAAAVAAINDGSAVNVAIYLRQGTYRLTEALAIDGKTLTAEEYGITFVGNADESRRAVITSAVDIDGMEFEQLPDEYCFFYTLPEEYLDDDGNYPAFRDLYYNGKSMKLATSEKDGVMLFDSAAHITTENAAKIKKEDRLLYVRPSLLGSFTTDDDGYIVATDPDGNIAYDDDYKPIRANTEFWVKTEWQIHCVHVERILPVSDYYDKTSGEYLVPVQVNAGDWQTFAKDGTYWSTLKNRPYWFSNALTYLDEPGEFYYDRATGTVYLCPEGLIDRATVSFPTAEGLFRLTDVRNVTLSNLNFYGVTVNYITDYGYMAGQGGSIKRTDPKTGTAVGFLEEGAVSGKNVANILIDGCNISNVGNDAINFRGAVSDVAVTGCTMENIGGTAIRFGAADNTYNSRVYNHDIIISGNYIKSTGTVFTSNVAIFTSSIRDSEITYNTILDSSYTAISVGYMWGAATRNDDDFVNVKNVTIANNYIEDFMTGMSDGGAIYTLGGNASLSYAPYLNTVCNNVIVVNESVGNYCKGSWTVIYHDGSSSHWEDYDNFLIISEYLPNIPYTFISYQTVSGQQTYHIKTDSIYIIGYPKDRDIPDPADDPAANPDFAGYYVVTGRNLGERMQTFRRTVNDDGSYTVIDKNMEDNDLSVLRAYLYDDYSDPRMSDEVRDKLSQLYEEAGAEIGEKPLAYGEMPAKSYAD